MREARCKGSYKRVGFNYTNLFPDMGVSENSVPLNPMVNDHYPY